MPVDYELELCVAELLFLLGVVIVWVMWGDVD